MHILFYQFCLSSVIKAETGSHGGGTFFLCFFERVLASAISHDKHSPCLSWVCVVVPLTLPFPRSSCRHVMRTMMVLSRVLYLLPCQGVEQRHSTTPACLPA